MKLPLTPAALALILLCSCNGMGPVSRNATVIRSGTFFGMCHGYCIKDVTITPESAVFVERGGRDTVQFPTKSSTVPVTADEWNDLIGALQMDSLAKLDSVIGCPDCADGGGEWIEVETSGTRRKVTFEHGATIPSIAPLLEKVRAIRAKNG